MAMGNNGNYFQHSIELLAARCLIGGSGDKKLHIALAHGMALEEPCKKGTGGFITGALTGTEKSRLEKSYRDTNASFGTE